MNFLNNPMASTVSEDPYQKSAASAHQAGLDAQARKAGFRNYDELRVYMLARQNQSGGTIQGHTVPHSIDEAKQMVQRNIAPAHPASIFQYLSDALAGANGQ